MAQASCPLLSPGLPSSSRVLPSSERQGPRAARLPSWCRCQDCPPPTAHPWCRHRTCLGPCWLPSWPPGTRPREGRQAGRGGRATRQPTPSPQPSAKQERPVPFAEETPLWLGAVTARAAARLASAASGGGGRRTTVNKRVLSSHQLQHPLPSDKLAPGPGHHVSPPPAELGLGSGSSSSWPL